MEATSSLRLNVFAAPTKRINPSFLPNAPEGGLTWRRDLGRWIESPGKRLTTIYITHSHSGHYFGLTILREQFPAAKAVAMPVVAKAIDPGGPSLSSVERANESDYFAERAHVVFARDAPVHEGNRKGSTRD